jgi:hypothetical protein
MSMSSFFLPPNKLFHNEAATLNRIKNNPIFRRHFKQLVSDAEDYLLRINKPIQKKTLKEFNFKSLINDISLNGQLGTAHISVLIKTENNDYAQLTYDIAICDNRKIIRKFHFDYTPENIKKRGSHPVFHLQYPGKLSAQLLGLKLAHDHLDAGLSEPRIPFTPMSLALTINLILKEFPDERTNQAVEDKTWRELIKTNEKDFLYPYFKECNTFFLAPPENKLFTNDFCYGSL